MTDELTIMTELGDDTDLLLAPDEWLDNLRLTLQQEMSLIADQLDGVLAAQRIKIALQQRNMVAVRVIEKTNNMPSDAIIKICPLPDAINRLEKEMTDKSIPNDISAENARQQIATWRSDGYDIRSSERVKRKKYG